MSFEARHGSSSGTDADFPRLEGLLREHLKRFGRDVCDLVVTSARQRKGLAGVLETLGIVSENDTILQIGRLISWLDANGSRALFQVLAPETSAYKLKPVEASNARAHDQRLLELVVKTRKAPPTSPAPPTRSAATHGESAPPPATPPGTGYPSPSLPATPNYPAPPAAVAPPQAPRQPADVSSATHPSGGPFTGPPGYPYPWPPHLRPGPVAPPPNIPPEQLSWPHIERRSGQDRRKSEDRRNKIDIIFKNRRFGGERRKGDRRKGGGGKPSS